jgi:hypothetical protein
MVQSIRDYFVNIEKQLCTGRRLAQTLDEFVATERPEAIHPSTTTDHSAKHGYRQIDTTQHNFELMLRYLTSKFWSKVRGFRVTSPATADDNCPAESICRCPICSRWSVPSSGPFDALQ